MIPMGSATPKPMEGSGRMERYDRRQKRRAEAEKLERKAKLAEALRQKAIRFRVFLRDGRKDRAYGTPLKFETDNLFILAHCHHIVHKSAGGSDEDFNRCVLSPDSHKMHHDGLLEIEGNGNETLAFAEYEYKGGTRVLVRRWEN